MDTRQKVTVECIKEWTYCVPTTTLQVPLLMGWYKKKHKQNKNQKNKTTKTYTKPLYCLTNQMERARL